MKYEDLLNHLNEWQLEAVLDESEACVVNANVGSGKTTVLTNKIIYLHYAKNISYSDMVVLTFTNKAANEIKERLYQLDDNISENELKYFGTFHSVALQILKNSPDINQLGYRNDFAVITPDEEYDLACEILQNGNLTIKYKNRLKKRLEFEQTSRYSDDLPKLRELLQKHKKQANKMSFQDLITNASYLLKNNNYNFKWVIVDEVQDSDSSQLEFISLLKNHDTSIFAVGDPNQIIYSWRGNNTDVFSELKTQYQAKELCLPINYRSSATILDVARCFLEKQDDLIGINETGTPVTIREQYDSFQDANCIAEEIIQLHNSGTLYNEIAIFYRTREQSKTFEKVFEKNSIPFFVSVKKSILDIPVLNWLVKILRFSVDTTDIKSAIYVLTDKKYGYGYTSKVANSSIKDMLNNINPTDNKLLFSMINFKKNFSTLLSLESLYDYFDLDFYLQPTSSTFLSDKNIVLEFLKFLTSEVSKLNSSLTDNITTVLNQLSLNNGLFSTVKDENSVQLMTLHASKGLEFEHVYITCVNDGSIPLKHCNPDIIEEQRLFFVGITRAKKSLTISYYTKPDNPRVCSGASCFLRKIPNHIISNIDQQQSHDLHSLKKQIIANRQKMVDCDLSFNNETYVKAKTELPPQQYVTHPKYGKGVIINEDDLITTVSFDGYGEKEFIKAFSELTYCD